MARRHRIVHATDFSIASRAAFSTAVELARARRAELVICHVLTPVVAPLVGRYLAPGAYVEVAALAQRHASDRLAALARRARRAGVRVRARLVEGPTFERVNSIARSEHADLLVIGTHGDGALVRMLLGSVAHRVVATSTVPVLTVRAAHRGRQRRKAAA